MLAVAGLAGADPASRSRTRFLVTVPLVLASSLTAPAGRVSGHPPAGCLGLCRIRRQLLPDQRGGQPAYLVVITGKFKLDDAPVPPGARLPTGRYLAVTVNPATFQVMDLGLGNHKPPVPLRSYGPVSNLMKQK